jgi:hypothetical protein
VQIRALLCSAHEFLSTISSYLQLKANAPVSVSASNCCSAANKPSVFYL